MWKSASRKAASGSKEDIPISGIALLERSVFYDEHLDASAPFRTHSANDKLGLLPEPIDNIVAGAYREFKHLGKPGCGCSA